MLKLLGTSYLLAALSVAEGYTTMGDVTIRTRNYSASFQSAQTAFGPRYGWRGYDLDGMVVLQTPRDPCYTADYRPASSVGDNDTMKIALLSNAVLGACSADTAVWAMQKAGYDGVIIFNPLNDLLYVLGGSGIVPAPILIPTVFVGISCGSVLAKYQAQSGVDVELKIDGWINLALYLIPLACVVGVCVIVIIIFLIARWCCEVRRRRRSRLSKSNLKKLPIIKFKSGRDVYETCAICLDDYENGDKLRVLPCKHAFHSACIDPWLLQQKRVCPCCKRRVMTSRGQPVVPQDVADSSDSSDTDDEHRPLLHAPASDAERRYLTPVYSDDQPTPDRASRDFWEAVNRARRRAEDAPIDESHEEYLSIPVSRPSTGTSYGSLYSTPTQSPLQTPDSLLSCGAHPTGPSSHLAGPSGHPLGGASRHVTTEPLDVTDMPSVHQSAGPSDASSVCDHQGACACAAHPTVEVEGDIEDEEAPLIVKVQVEVPRKKKKPRKSNRSENGPI